MTGGVICNFKTSREKMPAHNSLELFYANTPQARNTEDILFHPVSILILQSLALFVIFHFHDS